MTSVSERKYFKFTIKCTYSYSKKVTDWNTEQLGKQRSTYLVSLPACRAAPPGPPGLERHQYVPASRPRVPGTPCAQQLTWPCVSGGTQHAALSSHTREAPS